MWIPLIAGSLKEEIYSAGVKYGCNGGGIKAPRCKLCC